MSPYDKYILAHVEQEDISAAWEAIPYKDREDMVREIAAVFIRHNWGEVLVPDLEDRGNMWCWPVTEREAI